LGYLGNTGEKAPKLPWGILSSDIIRVQEIIRLTEVSTSMTFYNFHVIGKIIMALTTSSSYATQVLICPGQQDYLKIFK